MATLTSVTLARGLVPTSMLGHVRLTSMTTLTAPSGMKVGDLIYFNGETMKVLDVGQNPIRVQRAIRGFATAHAAGETGYWGNPALFKSVDPQGIPPDYPIADPWINTKDGRVWIAQGSQVGYGTHDRYWQLQTSTRSVGALGVIGPAVITP